MMSTPLSLAELARRSLQSQRVRVFVAGLGAIVMVVLFVYMMRSISLSAVIGAMATAHPIGMLGVVIGCVLGQMLRIWRARRLLSMQLPHPPAHVAQAVLGAQVINWLSPVRFGDLWRLLRLTNRGRMAGTLIPAVSGLIAEKSSDALVLAGIATWVALIGISDLAIGTVMRLIAIAAAGLLVIIGIGAVSSNRARTRLLSQFPSLAQQLNADSGQLNRRERLRHLLEAVGFSVPIWGTAVLTNLAAATAIGLSVDIPTHLFLLIAMQTSMVFSPVPGNVGIQSAVTAAALTPLGFALAESVALGAILWAVSYSVMSMMALAAIVLDGRR